MWGRLEGKGQRIREVQETGMLWSEQGSAFSSAKSPAVTSVPRNECVSSELKHAQEPRGREEGA